MTGTEPTRLPVTPEQLAFLDEPRFAVVATVGADGLPHQTVMWYERDGDSLVLSTAPLDHKAAELLSRDRVTLRLVVDHVHSNGFG